MTLSDETGALHRRLEGLDLTADVDNVMHVEATFIQRAGKVRYKTRKKGGGLTRKRPERNPEQSQRDGKQRAIRSMQEIAHAERLDHFVTLTFAHPVNSDEAMEAWSKALRSKHLHPARPYLYALEYSAPGENLHIHAMTRRQTAENLRHHWPHGFVDIRRVAWDEIDAVCAYIGKHFADINRPEGGRYRASRGSRPPRQKLILADEVALFALTLEASQGREICSTWSIETGLGRYGQLAWDPNEDL